MSNGEASNASKLASSAAGSFATAGNGGILIWAFQCWSQHQIIVPDATTALLMSAYVVPVFHAGGILIRALVERWFKVDLNGNDNIGNGAATTETKP